MKGGDINLDSPSVGATENIMLASVYAVGVTTVINVAKEPEIVDLQNFLNSMGANVDGAGTDTIVIRGVESLHDVQYEIMPDRIVAGTHLVAAAITGGEIVLRNVRSDQMIQVLAKLEDTGCIIKTDRECICIKGPQEINPVDLIRTNPHPGFPTDMQPQFMSLLTLARGTSIIIETVFDSRFKTVPELIRMGADISTEGRSAFIKGVKRLKGAHVVSKDLRGGAALILAGLAADGETIVSDNNYIERGYENIYNDLKMLGADIEYNRTDTIPKN